MDGRSITEFNENGLKFCTKEPSLWCKREFKEAVYITTIKFLWMNLVCTSGIYEELPHPLLRSTTHYIIIQIWLFEVYSNISSFENKYLSSISRSQQWSDNISVSERSHVRILVGYGYSQLFLVSILYIFLKSLHLKMIVASELSSSTYFFLTIVLFFQWNTTLQVTNIWHRLLVSYEY